MKMFLPCLMKNIRHGEKTLGKFSGTLVSLIMLTWALPAQAQTTFTWSGAGDGVNWSDGANWVGGSAPTSNARLIFPSAANRGSVTTPLNADLTDASQSYFTVDSIQFDNSNGAYYLGGNNLRLNPGATDRGFEVTSTSTGTVFIGNNVTVSASSRWTIDRDSRTMRFDGVVTLDTDAVVSLQNGGARPIFHFANSVEGSGVLRQLTGFTTITRFDVASPNWSGGLTMANDNRGLAQVGADGALGTGTVDVTTRNRFIIAQVGAAPSITLDNAFNVGGDTGSEYLRFDGNFTIGSASNGITLRDPFTPPIDPVGTTTVAGAISEAGGTRNLTVRGYTANFGEGKAGSGTLILTSTNNSYTGTTLVWGGSSNYVKTLQVDGSITSSSGVTVGDRGILKGSGSVPGVTVQDGGTLAIGNSIGTMTFEGDLTLDLNSTSIFEIDGFTAGQYDLALGGAGTETASFNGHLQLVFFGGFNTLGTVKIFDFENYAGSFATFDSTGLADGYSATFNELNGTVTVVPEPSTYAMLALAGAGFAAHIVRRRRRRQL